MGGVSEDSTTRLDELESLRGLAALLVVLFHMPQWYPPFHAFPIIRNGGFMVDFFFVLSGFVICRAYGDRLQSPRDVLRFQLLRLGRLYPVHLLFLFAFLGVEIARWMVSGADAAASGVAPFGFNSGAAFALQLGLLQAWGDAAYWGTYNGPAWSISIEFYGYFIFALAALLGRTRRGIVFLLLFLVGAALLAGGWAGNPNISRFLAGFFAGVLVARGCAGRAEALPNWLPAVALLTFAVILWTKPNTLSSVLRVVGASALVIAAIAMARDGAIRRLLRHRAFVAVGAWSYSIYMAHFLVIYIASQLANRLLTAPRALVDGNILPQPGMMIAVLMLAGVVMATLGISALVFHGIEAPLRDWTRRRVAARFGPVSRD